jgi:hypothetical protein
VDCRTRHLSRRQGRINERPGVVFPYELSVRADLRALLNEFTVGPDG